MFFEGKVKMKKSSLTNIIFILGLLLIIVQCFIFESMLHKGLLPSLQYVNFSVLIYDLCYLLGIGFLGLVGVVLTVIGAIRLHKEQ